jgi:hypothetical protein
MQYLSAAKSVVGSLEELDTPLGQKVYRVRRKIV